MMMIDNRGYSAKIFERSDSTYMETTLVRVRASVGAWERFLSRLAESGTFVTFGGKPRIEREELMLALLVRRFRVDSHIAWYYEVSK
jgi:hypothetical protein